jgi:tRNA (cmo5U34)-methyltransferase
MTSVWREPEHVADYLRREIPYREVAEQVMLEALPETIDRFLDLGSGDGRLVRLIREHHPEARGVGIDFSEPMLARARELCAGDPAIELRGHDLAEPLAEVGSFDAVVSGLAIHHLEDQRRRALFAEVRDLLAPGGVFANLDVVEAGSSEAHIRFQEAIGLPEGDPADRPAALADQLDWLRDAGFEDVDCHFKWLELALLIATNPAEPLQ